MKKKLIAAFKIVDMQPISFYLKLKISRDREKKTIKLSQPLYIDKILAKFYLSQANTSNIPMIVIPLELNNKKAIATKRERYQGITSLIILFMVEIRSDIAFATSVISQFAKNLFH